MPLIDAAKLAAGISPPLDSTFADQLIREFISTERRFILRDWEPAELDGGQFAEILARIYYHLDSGTLNQTKGFDECVSYIEGNQNSHAIVPRQDALHVCRVLRTIYKFRSQRGAVHISPTYQANHMDARLMMESVRWAFSETLRRFWNGDRTTVAKAVKEILDFDVPCVGRFDDLVLVQRTDLSAEEELLILLHYAGTEGFTRQQLGKFAQCSPSSVTTALQRLCSPDLREVVQLSNRSYRLTDGGEKRVREELAEKLQF